MALTAYTDADHAGCQDTRRSTSGSSQFLGDKLVSWSSKKQTSTSISSTSRCLVAMCPNPMDEVSIIRLWLRLQSHPSSINWRIYSLRRCPENDLNSETLKSLQDDQDE
ncbi:copia protein [Tanacetum coccineum]